MNNLRNFNAISRKGVTHGNIKSHTKKVISLFKNQYITEKIFFIYSIDLFLFWLFFLNKIWVYSFFLNWLSQSGLYFTKTVKKIWTVSCPYLTFWGNISYFLVCYWLQGIMHFVTGVYQRKTPVVMYHRKTSVADWF